MRVALARLLLSPAGDSGTGKTGLLILDEPSNHLDQQACTWLARWLRTSSCAVVLVSHDELLLDSACTRLAEVRGRTIHTYTGGYSAFLEERKARSTAALQRATKLDKEAAKLEGFITRFGAKATKASAAKSKEKALARLNDTRDDDEVLESAAAAADSTGPGDASRVRLRLPPPPPCAQEALSLSGAAFGWGLGGPGAPLLSDVNVTLERGWRVVLCGPNGAGKTTLLRALAGNVALRSGRRKLGQDASLGFFRQDLAQELPLDAVALDHVCAAARAFAPDTTEERVRGVLGALGLRADAVFRRIGDLSGGEKARVALASLVLQPSPILLLDEPSNHADLASVEALSSALRDWGGLVVVATHSRAFATSLAPTHIVTVAGGRVRLTPTAGVFSEAGWDAAVTAALDAAAGQAAAAGAAAPAAPPAAAAAGGFGDRQKTKKSRQRLEKCFALIEAAETEIGTLDATVAAAFEKGDGPGAAKAAARQDKLRADVEKLFEEAEQLETELAGAPV